MPSRAHPVDDAVVGDGAVAARFSSAMPATCPSTVSLARQRGGVVAASARGGTRRRCWKSPPPKFCLAPTRTTFSADGQEQPGAAAVAQVGGATLLRRAACSAPGPSRRPSSSPSSRRRARSCRAGSPPHAQRVVPRSRPGRPLSARCRICVGRGGAASSATQQQARTWWSASAAPAGWPRARGRSRPGWRAPRWRQPARRALAGAQDREELVAARHPGERDRVHRGCPASRSRGRPGRPAPPQRGGDDAQRRTLQHEYAHDAPGACPARVRCRSRACARARSSASAFTIPTAAAENRNDERDRERRLVGRMMENEKRPASSEGLDAEPGLGLGRRPASAMPRRGADARAAEALPSARVTFTLVPSPGQS